MKLNWRKASESPNICHDGAKFLVRCRYERKDERETYSYYTYDVAWWHSTQGWKTRDHDCEVVFWTFLPYDLPEEQ